jgi:hypothetical protein
MSFRHSFRFGPIDAHDVLQSAAAAHPHVPPPFAATGTHAGLGHAHISQVCPPVLHCVGDVPP